MSNITTALQALRAIPPSPEWPHLPRSARAAIEAGIAALSAAQDAPAFDMVAHLRRQAEFSARTFGPGARVQGVTDHMVKELREVRDSGGSLAEWVDVIILAFDGAWRSGATPEEIIAAIVAKQTKNEGRAWPDWRTADPNKAIEHNRSGEAAPAPALGAPAAKNSPVGAGIAAHCLAGEIIEALLSDEKDGGYDLTAGLFGANFSRMVRRWAVLELEDAALAAQPAPVPTASKCGGCRCEPSGSDGEVCPGPDGRLLCDDRAPTAAQAADISQAVRDVLAERQRQVVIEGFDARHDDENQHEEMAFAAACYVTADEGEAPPAVWPWGLKWWKPEGRRTNLIKAAALTIAELERLDRASTKEPRA